SASCSVRNSSPAVWPVSGSWQLGHVCGARNSSARQSGQREGSAYVVMEQGTQVRDVGEQRSRTQARIGTGTPPQWGGRQRGGGGGGGGRARPAHFPIFSRPPARTEPPRRGAPPVAERVHTVPEPRHALETGAVC